MAGRHTNAAPGSDLGESWCGEHQIMWSVRRWGLLARHPAARRVTLSRRLDEEQDRYEGHKRGVVKRKPPFDNPDDPPWCHSEIQG